MASISLKNKSKSGNLTAPGDVDPGAMIPIATVTVGTAQSTITFSSIPQNYEHLQIRGISKTSYTGASQIGLRFNSDNTTNYNSHYLEGDGTSAAGGNIGAANVAIIARTTSSGGGYGTSNFGALVLDVLDYANTNKYKTTRCLNGWDVTGGGYSGFYSGLWLSTSAVNTITLYIGGGAFNFAQYSSFALYGIKRAGA